MSAETLRSALVLHVNDSTAARYLGTRILRGAGFEVLEATTGHQALDIVRGSPAPEVVVLDVLLPDIDGFEVCRRIKALSNVQPVKVLHTSVAVPASPRRVEGLAAGGDLYLAHPYEPEELVASVRALVKLRRAELQLRDRAERLHEADQRKDEFLAMLAHELRNPLAAITTAVALMPKGEGDITIPARLRSIITRGHIDLKIERVDLADLTRRVVSSVGEARAEARSVAVSIDAPEGPLEIDADPARIEQIVANLVDNALKYTPSGGAVSVMLRPHAGAEGAPPIGELVVRDTGIGIAPGDLTHVFSTFYQVAPGLARSGGGLGLGLALVKRLVELHGGTVEARSAGPGRGSEFVVRLPLATGPRPVDPVPPPPVTTALWKILIVDDNLDACEVLAEQLSAWGHDVTCAHDGRSAIARCLEGGFDLALVDLGLPLADGFEVARRVRAEMDGRSPAMIAVTGYGGPEHRAEARAAGFDDHLVKPVDLDALRRALASLDPATAGPSSH
jgi:CheY-like chemotaxis protein/two-component sensor histidine kinase